MWYLSISEIFPYTEVSVAIMETLSQNYFLNKKSFHKKPIPLAENMCKK